MKKKLFKHIVSLAILLMLAMPVVALAQTVDPWGGQEMQIEEEIGLGGADPRVMTARIINVALGFLGIIAVIIILLGGFKWMTAGGNEDKTAEARKLIAAGIIGLIIILAAWAIARFVISALYEATTAT